MCGQVRFELAEAPLGALYCHCKRCQRRTGTAFSASALTVPGSFRLTAGERENPELISVRMGAFDDDPGVRPSAHQFTTYAPPWAPVADDGMPRYPERIDPGATPPP